MFGFYYETRIKMKSNDKKTTIDGLEPLIF